MALGTTVAAATLFSVITIVVQPDPNWTGGLGSPRGVHAVRFSVIVQPDPGYTGG
jgi:hypothetical protein